MALSFQARNLAHSVPKAETLPSYTTFDNDCLNNFGTLYFAEAFWNYVIHYNCFFPFFPLIFSLFCTGDFYSLLSKLLGEREDVVRVHKHNPTEKAESDLVAEIANIVQKKDLAREITSHDEGENTILVRDRIHKFHKLKPTLRPPDHRHFSLQQPKHGEGNWEKEHAGGRLGVNFLQWNAM